MIYQPKLRNGEICNFNVWVTRDELPDELRRELDAQWHSEFCQPIPENAGAMFTFKGRFRGEVTEETLPHEALGKRREVPEERPEPLPLLYKLPRNKPEPSLDTIGLGGSRLERWSFALFVFFMTLIYVILATRGLFQ